MNEPKLTASAVREILTDCLLREGEVIDNQPAPGIEIVVGHGVMTDFGLHKQRIEARRTDIAALLAELPSEFREGWSFLNACVDRHGRQWGEHVNVEQLMALGEAAGLVSIMPREMWSALPDGMPYLQVLATPTHVSVRTALLPVQSSQIRAIGYDPDRRVAVIEFHAKTGQSVYRFENVEPELLAEILFAPSIGSAFGKTVKADKTAYPYRKLEYHEYALFEYEHEPAWLAAVEPFRQKSEVAA